MIITKIMGGMGNQLFQYALGRHLSIINQLELKLDTSSYEGNIGDPMLGIRTCGLDYFNIKATVASEDDLAGFKTNVKNRVLKKLLYTYKKSSFYSKNKYYYISEPEENLFKFMPKILSTKLTAEKTYIKGYWQTEKYFKDISDTIRQDFAFKDEPDEANKKMLEDIDNADSVSIHVRHGDNANNVAPWHGALPVEYYEQAISRLAAFVKDPVFYVFSDNPEWSRDNIKTGYPTIFVSHNGDEKNHEDLRLMSRCKHHIIANSTFGWWGAWLGKSESQKIIAPKNYYINFDVSQRDFYPEGWIIL